MHDGLARAGYLNQKFGIPHEIIRDRIYLYSKFLIGTYAYTGFAAMGVDLGDKKTKKYYIFEEIFKKLEHEILLFNRLENIHLYFPVEGYEVKHNDQYIQAGTFSFEKYNELLSINYLNFPESMILSKKYRII